MNDLTHDRPSHRKRQRSHADSQSVNGITQKAVLLLVLLVSAALLFVGVRMTAAGIASYQAEAFLQDWTGKGTEPDPSAWTVAQDAAQRAVNLYPVANGEYFDRLGLVHSWQHFAQPYGSPDALSSRLAALDAYRASLEARPVWPNTWARLATTKLQLAVFDGEFKQALARAAELGPSRSAVQREVISTAFAAWLQLSETERERFLESARRSVAYSQREAQQVHSMATQHGVSNVLCKSLDTDIKTTRKLCQ